MATKETKIVEITCGKCGHVWTPESVGVAKCPKCNAEHWAYTVDK